MNESKQGKPVEYLGVNINPGNRTGNKRRNYIKRKKAQVRANAPQQESQRKSAVSRAAAPRGSANQNAQLNSGRGSARPNNKRPGGGGPSEVMRVSKQFSGAGIKAQQDLATYIGTVLDPFDAPDDEARVPTRVPFPSACVTMRYTGSITPNASGNFGLIMQPQCGVTAQGWREFVIVMDAPSFSSTTNFVQTATGNGYGLRSSHMPIGLATRARTVAAGIRCWYVGKEIDRSGYYVSAFVPKSAIRGAVGAQPEAVATGYTENELREHVQNRVVHNKQMPEVTWLPRDDVDYDYMAYADGRETSILVIQGFGMPTQASCIKWEAVVHMEYVPDPGNATGKLINTSVTHANHDDAASVMSHISHDHPQYSVAPEGPGLFKRFMDVSMQVGSGLIDKVGEVAGNYIERSFNGEGGGNVLTSLLDGSFY